MTTGQLHHSHGDVYINPQECRMAEARRRTDAFGPTPWVHVELFTFQVLVGGTSPRFCDMKADGLLKVEEAPEQLKNWCEQGAMPVGLKVRPIDVTL